MEILGVGAFGSSRLLKTNEGEFAEKLMIIKEKESFEEEIQSLLHVSHPNIVRHVCYYFEETSFGFRTIVRIEFHSRGTLDKLIHESSFTYSVATVIEWTAELFAALSYLVTVSIVHKNVKPSNVLLSQDFKIKLCDFGCGKDFLQDLMNTSNAGFAAYMSPEANGYGNPNSSIITTASDVYGVGIVLWEVVERRRIFSAIRRKMDGFGIRSSLGQGELTVPLAEANLQIADLIHSSTMIDRHQRPSPANLFKKATGMKKWDIYEKYSIEPILTGGNTTEKPLGIKEEPRFCEEMDNGYEVCKRIERLPQRGCSRNSAFKNKEKYSNWKEKRSLASPIKSSLDDRGKWRKMSENEYEITRGQKERGEGEEEGEEEQEQEQEEEVRWRRPEVFNEPISPSEDEGYSRLANFTSVTPSEGFYETIEDLPSSSGIQRQSNRQAKVLINLSQINNLAATSLELNGSTEEWMVRIEKLKSTPRYCVAQSGFYEKNGQQVEIDSRTYEDFIRISDAAWKKQRNSYSYQIMQMMVMNLERKQLLPLIKKLCLNEYYSRAAWCTFFCIERFSIVDVNWLGIADCLFRIILRELIEQNIPETDPQIAKQVTRYIIIHHRIERLTKNEEIRQIWKIARFLLNFDISRYGSENETEFREVYLNVLKKLANDCKNEPKKKGGLPKDLVDALEADIEQMKGHGPSFEERKFCIALWSLPIMSSRSSF
ncbi:unnamed protein product, partial [Mesorhabditis belari]|uniref:Protein kinase domain-containing protein n=1 Tax=Mesorhabditis belari TaxID=2138241 RepID=A0AAF3EAE0_9BILA